jgi:hypothetical protein
MEKMAEAMDSLEHGFISGKEKTISCCYGFASDLPGM